MASGMEEENAQDQGETEAPDPQALRYISTPETKSGLAGQRTSGCRAPWAVAMRMSRDHGPRLGGRIFEPRWRHSQSHTQQAEWPDTRRRLRDPARRRRSEGGAVGRTPRPGPASFVPPRAPIGCSPETADLGRGPIGRARCRSAVGSLAIGGAAAGGLNRSPAGAGFARVPRWVGPRLCGAARRGGGPGRAGRAGRSDGRSSGTAAAVGARGEAGGAWAVARAALAEGGAARAGPGAAAAAAAGARRRGPLPLEAPREMLSGSLPEDSEAKEGERWYDPQDLQRDLQLAAELGKTLLDRNTELEESLQQMYTTNQEQLQEIEYLTKQVELLRQMNEQHAKVYEQLDITARELEDTNHKLVAESKASQQKIVSLTETIECLQTNIDHLQSQVEELKAAEQRSRSQGKCEQKWASSLSSLKELYDLRQHFVYDHVFAERIASLQSEPSPEQEEHERLRRAVAALQAQLGGERRRRQALEEELGLAARENGDLERQLGAARDTRARALQLEAEVAELRRRLRAEAPPEEAAPGALFLPFPSREPGPSLLEELCLAAAPDAPAPPRPLRRSRSDAELGGPAAPAHEDACARRAGPVARRGVALLHEVDLRYSALQAKYDELLRSCRQDPDSLAHKAVQTARPPPGAPAAGARSPQRPGSPGPAPPPEYKALFQEIFSCIRKTKQEIHEHRTKFPALAPQP